MDNHMRKIALGAGILIVLALVYLGCDRLKGTLNVNQRPVVEFVNVPLDSTLFSFAPTVYWYGHDADGLVEFYSLYDDTTHGAIDAYENNTLESYVLQLPPDVWVNTTATSAVVYLLTPAGDTTQHIFFIRCTDNDGAISDVRARAFFRTNQPPNHPQIAVLPNDAYRMDTVLTDTLLMGTTLTQTYGGLQILWTGNDPDDRALAIIPLQFSYLIVNKETNENVPFPGDTIQEDGWSKWSASKMKTLHGLETGRYVFYVKSRDDGLTECAVPASVEFYCIQPTFEHHLLVVDENGTRTGPGTVDADSVMAFHKENWEQAWAAMNVFYPDSHFVNDGVDLQVWVNRDVTGTVRIPYALIQQFQLVWIIDDDRQRMSNVTEDKIDILERYLDVGGMLMITGRRIFDGSFMIPAGESVFNGDNATIGQTFFYQYFNVSEGFTNIWSRSAPENIDFGGAVAALSGLPDLEVDTAKVRALQFGADRYYCLPDIDWVGRNATTFTIYYYYSCSADESTHVYNFDCKVIDSTEYSCKLLPQNDEVTYERLVSVSRIFNKTKNVFGQFMYFTDNNSAFVVSTPAWAGAWSDADTLEVDFTYIPISDNHLKPVATLFDRWQETIDYENYTDVAQLCFRTCLFSFPLYFIKNDPPVNVGGYELPRVAALLVYGFDWFYSQRSFVYHWGG
jgi:hypothetical protein